MDANNALLTALDIPDQKTVKTINAADLYHKREKREEIIELLKRDSYIKNKEVELRKYTGETIIVLLNARSVREPEGYVRMEGSFIDITEARQLEAEKKELADLQDRERSMEAIARLAAGIAHDINNILGGISGQTQVLQVKTKKNTELEGPLSTIMTAVEKAAEIIQGLLVSVGSYAFEIRQVKIGDFVRKAVGEFSRETGTGERIITEIGDEDFTVDMDESLAADMLRELL